MIILNDISHACHEQVPNRTWDLFCVGEFVNSSPDLPKAILSMSWATAKPAIGQALFESCVNPIDTGPLTLFVASPMLMTFFLMFCFRLQFTLPLLATMRSMEQTNTPYCSYCTQITRVGKRNIYQP